VADDLHQQLEARSTADLVEILRNQDAEEWRPEVFPLVEAILRDRGVDVAAVKTAGPLERERAEYSPLETVASFYSSLEANLCRMALVSAGIDAWLSTEHLLTIAPPLGIAIPVEVQVHAENASAARALLADIDAEAARRPKEPEVCPRCGSAETEHERTTDKTAALSAFALTSLPLATVAWRWKCRTCSHQWE
jgi:hypothetical protein